MSIRVKSRSNKSKMSDELKAVRVLQVFVLMIIVVLATALVLSLTDASKVVVLPLAVLIEVLIYFYGRSLKYR